MEEITIITIRILMIIIIIMTIIIVIAIMIITLIMIIMIIGEVSRIKERKVSRRTIKDKNKQRSVGFLSMPKLFLILQPCPTQITQRPLREYQTALPVRLEAWCNTQVLLLDWAVRLMVPDPGHRSVLMLPCQVCPPQHRLCLTTVSSQSR